MLHLVIQTLRVRSGPNTCRRIPQRPDRSRKVSFICCTIYQRKCKWYILSNDIGIVRVLLQKSDETALPYEKAIYIQSTVYKNHKRDGYNRLRQST